MYCPACGADLGSSPPKFCRKCGCQLDKASEPSERTIAELVAYADVESSSEDNINTIILSPTSDIPEETAAPAAVTDSLADNDIAPLPEKKDSDTSSAAGSPDKTAEAAPPDETRTQRISRRRRQRMKKRARAAQKNAGILPGTDAPKAPAADKPEAVPPLAFPGQSGEASDAHADAHADTHTEGSASPADTSRPTDLFPDLPEQARPETLTDEEIRLPGTSPADASPAENLQTSFVTEFGGATPNPTVFAPDASVENLLSLTRSKSDSFRHKAILISATVGIFVVLLCGAVGWLWWGVGLKADPNKTGTAGISTLQGPDGEPAVNSSPTPEQEKIAPTDSDPDATPKPAITYIAAAAPILLPTLPMNQREGGFNNPNQAILDTASGSSASGSSRPAAESETSAAPGTKATASTTASKNDEIKPTRNERLDDRREADRAQISPPHSNGKTPPPTPIDDDFDEMELDLPGVSDF